MFEIIVGIYITSFCLSMAILIWNYRWVEASYGSPKLQRLNQNLGRLGLFWSPNESQILSLNDNSLEDDLRRSKRNALFLGVLAFGSLPGFLLLLVVVLSMRRMAKPRREVFVMSSSLVGVQELGEAEILKIVEESRKIY